MSFLIFSLLILSVGYQLNASNLENEFSKFLSTSLISKSYEDRSIAVKTLYKLYKDEYQRSSRTSTEENLRFAAFNDTVFTLLKDNHQGDKTYTSGLNQYADWTPEELNNLRGLRRPNGKIIGTNANPNQQFLTLDGKQIQDKAAVVTLPASFDYTTRFVSGTNTPILTPIKNQGQCGSCYAFAFVALLEAQYAFQSKTSANLSEQQMVDCSTYDSGCNGGYFTNTFWYLQKNSWQVNSALIYPYKAVKASKCASKNAGTGVMTLGPLLYKNVPNNAIALQQALITYGPLWVSLFAGDSKSTNSIYRNVSNAFNSYISGVIKISGCPTSSQTTNHAVVIVGYGVDAKTNLPYWKVRNSWGNWGLQGYFLIQRGVNMCGIESDTYYIAKPA